jgi:hypothetical protein
MCGGGTKNLLKISFFDKILVGTNVIFIETSKIFNLIFFNGHIKQCL